MRMCFGLRRPDFFWTRKRNRAPRAPGRLWPRRRRRKDGDSGSSTSSPPPTSGYLADQEVGSSSPPGPAHHPRISFVPAPFPPSHPPVPLTAPPPLGRPGDRCGKLTLHHGRCSAPSKLLALPRFDGEGQNGHEIPRTTTIPDRSCATCGRWFCVWGRSRGDVSLRRSPGRRRYRPPPRC